jgi:transcription antitermination factor NusG
MTPYSHHNSGLGYVQHSSSRSDFLKWYALYTRSRCEKKVHQDLERAQIHAFLPLVKEKRQWSDRLKTVALPLLPGYIFVKSDPIDLKRALYCAGVVRVVSFCGKPCEVREEEMTFLEAIVQFGLPAFNTEPCCVGDRVRIVRGALKGWEGHVSRTQNGGNRVVFLVESIGQALSVELGVGEVERMG